MEIVGSPYDVEVIAGPASADYLDVQLSISLHAGDKAVLVARTRDAYENWLIMGGSLLDVVMRTTGDYRLLLTILSAHA